MCTVVNENMPDAEAIVQACLGTHEERSKNNSTGSQKLPDADELSRLREKLREAEATIAQLKASAEWQTCHVCVSSPLTSLSRTYKVAEKSGWAWRWFEVFCPCCKKPLDVTLLHAPPADQETEQPTSSGMAGVEKRAHPMDASCTPYSFEGFLAFVRGDRKAAQRMWDESELRVHPMDDTGKPYTFAGFLDHYSGDVAYARKRWEQSTTTAITEALHEACLPEPDKFAYVVVLWGSSPGFVLGAMVLGRRLKELGTTADLILMHTDDILEAHLKLLGAVWQLRRVDYIEGVDGLYARKKTRFDGVFTRINAWLCTDYRKVIMLDIDMIPIHSLDDLFQLPAPAAMVRGSNDSFNIHGDAVNGRYFFVGEWCAHNWPWRQGGGINAGLILLEPGQETHRRMLEEVTCENHPEHVTGSGPEQDYFTRFFADAPWHHIGVQFNFQIHHIPFALEATLNCRSYGASFHDQEEVAGSPDGDRWSPQRYPPSYVAKRLSMRVQDICNVHFSGDLKFWDLFLRGDLQHPDISAAVEEFLRSSLQGYELWFELKSPAADYEEFGCRLHENGKLELIADGSDVGPLVSQMREQVRSVTSVAMGTWRDTANLLLRDIPDLIAELRSPTLPAGCDWGIGTELDVFTRDQWQPCTVRDAQDGGYYIVCLKSSGEVERNVASHRLRVTGGDSLSWMSWMSTLSQVSWMSCALRLNGQGKRVHPMDGSRTPHTYAEFLEYLGGDETWTQKAWSESIPVDCTY